MTQNEKDTLRFCQSNTPEIVARQMVKDQERIGDLEREVAAWRERFPKMEFRRQDDIIDLKLSEFQHS